MTSSLLYLILSILLLGIQGFSPMPSTIPRLIKAYKPNHLEFTSFNLAPAKPMTLFASIGGNNPTTSGGKKTITLEKTDVKTEFKESLKEELDKDWRLILHDDEIHTIDEVCEIIDQYVPLCPGPRAYEVTLAVHTDGAATICVTNKKLVTEYLNRLKKNGLTVSMAPDDDFEDSSDDDLSRLDE